MEGSSGESAAHQPVPEDLIKTGEAARMLGVSPDTVANYCKQGRLSEYRTPGGWRLVSREEVVRLVSNSRVEGDQAD